MCNTLGVTVATIAGPAPERRRGITGETTPTVSQTASIARMRQAMGVRMLLLGRFEVRGGDDRPIAVAGTRVRALLARLAMEPGRVDSLIYPVRESYSARAARMSPRWAVAQSDSAESGTSRVRPRSVSA